MGIAASMLRSEMRRHLLMNVSLVASCVVGGTVVTNERGLFVPLNIHGMSDTARAFAAMFTQSHLLPDDNDLTDVRMASPLDPFEVTADSRDLRRRLMDALDFLPQQAADYDKELAQVDGQLPVVEVANNVNPGAQVGVAGAPAGGAGGAGAAAPEAAAVVPQAAQAAQAQQAQQQQANVLPVTNTSATQTSPGMTQDQVATVMAANTPPTTTPTTDQTVGAVPEPSNWAMLIAGFGMIGYLLRAAGRLRKRETGAVEATG